MGQTSSKKAPKAKQKIKGPAKSVSSMICPSIALNGFNTAIAFANMWEKLMPSSTIIHKINHSRQKGWFRIVSFYQIPSSKGGSLSYPPLENAIEKVSNK